MRIILIFPLCLISANAFAQEKQISHQELYWIRYYNQLEFNKYLTLHNEFDERRFFSPHKQHHLILHSRLHYKVSNNLELASGITHSLQSTQSPNSSNGLVVPEWRPFQEINYNIPATPKLKIQQRIRIDERFIHKNNGELLLPGYNFNMRWRYRLQVNYLLGNSDSHFPTSLKSSTEIMISTGSKIVYNQFDQRRVYFGLEQGLSKNFSVEVGYMNLFQQRATGVDFFNRNILRLTVYHKIYIKGKSVNIEEKL